CPTVIPRERHSRERRDLLTLYRSRPLRAESWKTAVSRGERGGTRRTARRLGSHAPSFSPRPPRLRVGLFDWLLLHTKLRLAAPEPSPPAERRAPTKSPGGASPRRAPHPKTRHGVRIT